ncbi:two component transcriptional regulator, winged helix family [Desulfofarcimen acetoxidans DSM 771]|uniref:Stage 0 sporulation protein A homolog n=1 Tax=Desulfofarcimen acetoxidans (strain ATCC 49208 / DSM 771 / KCTC 5769 / VKM B-1644 / 5575) TaxID=485916 RepID=C8VYB2_DESAS|nr:response regulator [Desulfofarcimen acetoxidans]ACV62793.1 two component transcriptional regulator, winged helix family [Desulfofarcimen acetoxidans DSM 771]
MPNILVVDDEQNVLEIVRFNLERAGYKVITAKDGNIALELARSRNPDLIVLDLLMPGLDGYSICRLLQRDPATRRIPIIMLSARSDELDKVLGLEMGADDYITKPFSPRELVARVNARLRRDKKEEFIIPRDSKNIIMRGKLIIDKECMSIELGGKKQYLKAKEFELLYFLACQPGKYFSRYFLLKQFWEFDVSNDSRTVDVHIRRIRQKLEILNANQQYIETARGVGYRFIETNL